ncbi:MAG: hypothetical protein ABR525_08835 [Candidatus Limnocylindria bacterium]
MRALLRLVAVALAGAVLYFTGVLNALVIRDPSPDGAVVVVTALAASLIVLCMALIGDGRDDASSPPVPAYRGPLRAAWLVVSVMALVGYGWLAGIPFDRSTDWTPYHNDAIALNDCAARLVTNGQNPYTDLDLFACYDRLGIGADRTTPLKRGLFRSVDVYPSDDALDGVWDIRRRGGEDVEFVWRPSYPALSFLALIPFVRAGLDTNLVYIGCLLASMALILVRSGRGVWPFLLTGLFGAACLTAFTVGGSADLLYALPLVAAWLWRERRWSAVAYGLAVATKQIAWFFGPFYLIQVATQRGWREALARVPITAGVFVVTNLPYIVSAPKAWLAGVLTPVVEPMFARGAGLVFLSTTDVLPLWPPAVYLALEGAGGVAMLAVAWRTRRSSPELGAVLPLLPLFLAYRSLFSYFFLLPLFAFAGIARMPLGRLVPALAREAGGLTLFALPFALPRRTSPRPGATVAASRSDAASG